MNSKISKPPIKCSHYNSCIFYFLFLFSKFVLQIALLYICICPSSESPHYACLSTAVRCFVGQHVVIDVRDGRSPGYEGASMVNLTSCQVLGRIHGCLNKDQRAKPIYRQNTSVRVKSHYQI